MAAPAAVVAAKAVLATAADKRTRTVVLSVAAALLVPFILIMTVILCTLSGAADHNTSAVNTAFHGGYLSSKVPVQYRMYIEKMQDSFLNLDQAIAEINDMAEDETLDADQVKSVFYSLFFGADQPRMGMEEYRKFADCFVTYEEREDEEGDSYTVAVPVHDLQTVYFNLNSVFGISAAMETQVNANRIYTLVKYGQALPGGNGMLPGEAMGDGSFATLMAEATKYIGWPYVWGGSSPATSFDCSGYICWVYTKSGVYHLPRTTAQGIFNQCAVIPKEEAKPGDLIFFTGTYASASPVSHVGIYVGGNQMLHCGSPIGYANIDSAYWSGHFYAMGRLPGGGLMKAIFERKPDFNFKDFVIEKTVAVPAEVFEDMLKHPLEDRPFITENISLMHQDEGGLYHCLLVTGRGRADGILVESEGYGYPRYASYVPEAAALQYPSLSKRNMELMSAVDFIITEGTARTTEGNWIIDFEELEVRTGLCVDGKTFLQEMLGDMLWDRPETADVIIDDGRIDIAYYLDFCPNVSENQQEEGAGSEMKMQ